MTTPQNKKLNKTTISKYIFYFLLITSITGSWTSLPFNNKIYAFHIFIVLYILSSGISFVKGEKKLSFGSKIMNFNLFIIVWYFYIILTFFWTGSLKYYFKYLILYTLMLYYYFILVSNNGDIKSLEKTLYCLYLCFIISLIIGLLEAKTNFRLWGSPYLRKEFLSHNITTYNYLMEQPTAYFHNPNNFGTFILFGIAFVLGFILHYKDEVKYYFILILAFVVLYLSNSRANMLGTVLIIISFIIFRFKSKINKQLLVKMFGITFIIVIIIINNIYFGDMFSELTSNIKSTIKMLNSFDFSRSSSGSTRYRWILMIDAFEIIKTNPFGVGAGNSIYCLGKMQNTSGLNIHNWLLELTLDFGLLFSICYITFYILVMKSLYECIYNEKSDNTFLKAIATGCYFSHVGFIIGMVSPSSIMYFIPYWVLLGVSISVININRKENY